MDTGLADRVVLVTGASGGIGGAAARTMAAEGARVVAHGFRGGAALDALAAGLGDRGLAVRADLRDEAAVDAMFAEAIAHFGRVDVAVVNAGIWNAATVPIADMTRAQWEETLTTDLTSAFLTCRAFLRCLRDGPRDESRDGPSIVLVASTAALFGEAGHGDYAAAKAGMAYGLTRTLKNEIVHIAPRGRVNCVCPGWTRTPMAEDAMRDPVALERVFATMPLRKVATAEDVAHVVAFLASDRLAGHLSGAIVPVAGGMEGRRLHG